MISVLRRIFRPNAHSRRVMAGLCAAFVLTTIFLSSVFVTAEADHDCGGRDCPICQEMQTCVANFELAGSAAPACDRPLPAPAPSVAGTVLCVRRAPATTLQSLDVRFDE